jgi:uncharacterized membrane protein YdfJ with MMPL/SSD domain
MHIHTPIHMHAPNVSTNVSFSMSFVETYTSFVARRRVWIIVFWSLSTLAGAVWGLKFLGATDINADPPHSSDAWKARNAFMSSFPEQANEQTAVLFVQRVDGGSVLTPNATRHFTRTLTLKLLSEPLFRGLQAYYLLDNPLTLSLAQILVSQDNKSTLVVVNYFAKDATAGIDFTRKLRALATEFSGPELKVGLTGVDVLWDQTNQESESDFVRMDSIVLPIALLVLALYLQNFRLVLLPMASVACSILSAFLIMYPVAKYMFQVRTNLLSFSRHPRSPLLHRPS